MPIYKTSGTLTDNIKTEGAVALAQDYLQNDDMTQYLDEPLQSAVDRIQWVLNSDGYNYYVEAITNRELTEAELELLSSWVSGQNSDGLGEGFEQQDFAEVRNYTCDEDDRDCLGECEEYSMISFDWQTNNCKFERTH